MIIAFLILACIVILYLFLIMPRMFYRPDYGPLFGCHYAHRGFHDNDSQAPENSLAAFLLAVENGYGIEFDIQLTKDKIPVVFHDDTLARVCGQPGHIWDYTFEELQAFPLYHSDQTIPLLKDVLELVDGRVPLIIEYKMHDSNTEVCSIADPLLQSYSGDYCIESFHPFAVRWYKKNHPRIIRGQLSADFSTPEEKENPAQWAVHMLLTNITCRPDFIAYSSQNTNNLSRTLCRCLFGALSVAWTIRSERELQQQAEEYDLFIFQDFRPEMEAKRFQ